MLKQNMVTYLDAIETCALQNAKKPFLGWYFSVQDRGQGIFPRYFSSSFKALYDKIKNM